MYRIRINHIYTDLVYTDLDNPILLFEDIHITKVSLNIKGHYYGENKQGLYFLSDTHTMHRY